MAQTDPTWDCGQVGRRGQPVDPHVYMPAQNPGDPSGMSAFGRWMYGPWFWPPAKDAKYPPIANPYYDPTCDPNVAAVLRAGADPVDAEHLGRHGGVQRHARSSTARPTRPRRSTRRRTASGS